MLIDERERGQREIEQASKTRQHFKGAQPLNEEGTTPRTLLYSYRGIFAGKVHFCLFPRLYPQVTILHYTLRRQKAEGGLKDEGKTKAKYKVQEPASYYFIYLSTTPLSTRSSEWLAKTQQLPPCQYFWKTVMTAMEPIGEFYTSEASNGINS